MKATKLNQIPKRDGEPSWMTEQRTTFLEQFQQLPSLSSSPSIKIHLDPALLDLEKHFVHTPAADVFIKGKEGTLKTLSTQEGAAYSDFIKKHYHTAYQQPDKLTSFVGAFVDQCIMIIIPDSDKTYSYTINLNDTIQGTIVHVLIIAGKNTDVTITDTIQTSRLTFVEAHAKHDAMIHFTTIANTPQKHIMTKRVGKTESNATINWYEAVLDGTFVKADTETLLTGEGGKSTTIGIFFGDQTSIYDINNTTRHQASHTSSDMKNKGILFGKAKTLHQGLINIQENARQCSGYQKQDTLLLGDKAEIDALPNLEIANHDVLCSHGATVAQLDDEQLFYLQSRGLGNTTAKQLLVQGFFTTLLDSMPEQTAEHLKTIIETKIKK